MKTVKEICGYKMYLVFSKNLNDEAIDAQINKFADIIKENGEVSEIDKWGKKRLAYPIKKESEGFYILVNFNSISNIPAEIRRIAQITEGILRILIIKNKE